MGARLVPSDEGKSHGANRNVTSQITDGESDNDSPSNDSKSPASASASASRSRDVQSHAAQKEGIIMIMFRSLQPQADIRTHSGGCETRAQCWKDRYGHGAAVAVAEAGP